MVRNWERWEHVLALDLYWNREKEAKSSDPNIREVANLIDRTPDAVIQRLANYTHLAPNGREGLSNGGRLCEEMWQEYYGNEEELAWEANRIREELEDTRDSLDDGDREAETGTYPTKREGRKGTRDFRALVKERYGEQCALCDIREPGLLQAAHVLPWGNYPEHRGDPENGLLLCYTHHRAFDIGVFTIDKGNRIKVNPEFDFTSDFLERTVTDQNGEPIETRTGKLPSVDHLETRNQNLHWWPPET